MCNKPFVRNVSVSTEIIQYAQLLPTKVNQTVQLNSVIQFFRVKRFESAKSIKPPTNSPKRFLSCRLLLLILCFVNNANLRILRDGRRKNLKCTKIMATLFYKGKIVKLNYLTMICKICLLIIATNYAVACQASKDILIY